MNSTVVYQRPGRAIRSSAAPVLKPTVVFLGVKGVGCLVFTLHFEESRMHAGGRAGAGETLVQRPLVALSPRLDMVTVSELRHRAVESETSKTFDRSTQNTN